MGHSDFGRMRPTAAAPGINQLAACSSETVPKHRNAVAGGSYFSLVWAVPRSAESLRVSALPAALLIKLKVKRNERRYL